MKNLWKGVKSMAKETISAINSTKFAIVDNIAKGTTALFTNKQIMMASGIIIAGVGASMIVAAHVAM